MKKLLEPILFVLGACLTAFCIGGLLIVVIYGDAEPPQETKHVEVEQDHAPTEIYPSNTVSEATIYAGATIEFPVVFFEIDQDSINAYADSITSNQTYVMTVENNRIVIKCTHGCEDGNEK